MNAILIIALAASIPISYIVILMRLNELATNLTALADQVDKIVKEVQALKDALTNVDLPPEATAALDRLSAAIKTADDLNPDATT